MRHALSAILLAFMLAGCVAGSSSVKGYSRASSVHPQARSYDADDDARTMLDAALARATIDNTLVLVAMGGNWCHDSRAVAGWMETARFAQLLAEHYELVFIDVGMPRIGEGRNLAIVDAYGVDIEGTPTVLILSSGGELLNRDSAKDWNDAASRSADAIYQELQSYALRPRG